MFVGVYSYRMAPDGLSSSASDLFPSTGSTENKQAFPESSLVLRRPDSVVQSRRISGQGISTCQTISNNYVWREEISELVFMIIHVFCFLMHTTNAMFNAFA